MDVCIPPFINVIYRCMRCFIANLPRAQCYTHFNIRIACNLIKGHMGVPVCLDDWIRVINEINVLATVYKHRRPGP